MGLSIHGPTPYNVLFTTGDGVDDLATPGERLGTVYATDIDVSNLISTSSFGVGEGIVLTVGSDNFVVNLTNNAVDTGSGINISTIAGGGGPTTPNRIGQVAKPAATPGHTPVAEFVNDTGYPADGTAGSVGTIGGGYDHVMNQLAGTISGGGHNFIKYNVNGHSIIGGGSWNLVTEDGYRAVIAGGFANIADNGFTFVGGGTDNRASGSHSSVVGGQGNSATDSYGVVLGGLNNVCSGAYTATAGSTNAHAGDFGLSSGFNNTITGAYLTCGGKGNIAVGSYSAMFGEGNETESSSTHSAVFGKNAKTKSQFSLVVGATQKALVGDTQVSIQACGKSTSGATLTTMSGTLKLDTSFITAGIGKVRVVGIDDAGNVVVMSKEFGFRLNQSTNASLIDLDAGTITTSSGPTLTLDTHRDEITVGTCQIRMTIGELLVRVTGKAATNIHWTGSIEVTQTMTS